jgi:hypothetical protein
MKRRCEPSTVMVQDLDELNSILEVLYDASVCNLINIRQWGLCESTHRATGYYNKIELWTIKIVIMDIFLKEEVL